MSVYTRRLSLFAVTALSVIGASVSQADDIELYLNQLKLQPEKLRPNVMLVLDTSGSMGLPVKQYTNGMNSGDEEKHYDEDVDYPGNENAPGGTGDDNFIYLYKKTTDTYAGHLVYYNKVHRRQMLCELDDIDDDDPFEIDDDDDFAFPIVADTSIYENADSFIFNDGTWNWGHMCAQNDKSCRFRAHANGPKVDCKDDQEHIEDDDAYPPSRDALLALNANAHNYLQSFYRFSVLQRVVKDIIDKPFDVNMSLLRFNNQSGGLVIKESVNANSQNRRKELRKAIDNLHFNAATPLTESLREASRFIRGENAHYGVLNPNPNHQSVRAAFDHGTTYNSPIDHACQKSHIILLTDGNPTEDSGEDTSIQQLANVRCYHTDEANSPEESCLDDLAYWLHTDESTPSKRRDHSKLRGEQTITIHTVGFGVDNPLLAATAKKGGGLNKVASTAIELEQAFSSILEQATFEKDTFVAPAVAVNAYSGLQHREELYFALFQPQASPRWAGNIKKYTLSGDMILDRKKQNAINPDTGFFRLDSLSHWTTSDDLDDGDSTTQDPVGDGDVVELGGFAARLEQPATRNIYTYTSADSPTEVTLNEQLDASNHNITASMLGLDNAPAPDLERQKVLNWARGYTDGNSSMPANHFVGDFLHNRPAMVTYQTFRPTKQGDKPRFDDTVFAGSNMGFFHALDPDNGHEIFSFVPQALYPNLTGYYKDIGGFDDKIYGLDAPMTVWRYDEDGDGNIVNGSAVDGNDHVYIYQAMRRGGSNIYALDVTRRSQPVLKWRIDGQAFASTPSGDFRDLAQTWSVPQLGKIKWNCATGKCSDKQVLFFGGGYDEAHDTATRPLRRSKGNALYMVDAETGKLLWSAGRGRHHDKFFSNMNHSFAANVTIADADNDGYIDFLFAVDVQGGLWRMDFVDEPKNARHFATGGMIAHFGGNGINFRRFYNAPDVAYFSSRGKKPFLTISLSSGYRAHPRDTSIRDYLFVIYDKNAHSKPKNNNYRYVNNTRPIRFRDLSSRASQYGWYKRLGAYGEKGLSRTVTFGNKIIMTTYVPDIKSTCTGSAGNGRYYLLDALTGVSLLKTEDNKTIDYQTLKNSGIPAEPAIIYGDEEVCTENCDSSSSATMEERPNLIVCVGTECTDGIVEQRMYKTFWRENDPM